MAEPQSIITLNIGSQTVSMGRFSRSKDGGLILKSYESTAILADPAAEMTRLPQVKLAVGELANKIGLSKDKIDYAISGQSVFTRFVKLPMLEDDDLEQLVAFEAQQHVPFPINEVIWDWQLLESPGSEREVVLVAIKGDALDELNDCVSEAGLKTGDVDTSPMALANAFRYNYGDSEETSLLIDIGARTSNLIYIEGKRVFTRSIAIGGAAITSAISKEYNVSYMEAESQKVSNGMVALDTRHTSQLDELTGALATCIRTALNRMPAEIARTTNFYRSQHGGSAPTRVYLAGGGANLPRIGDFFQEKLRLPVEFFNPLKRISVGQEVDVDKVSTQAHQLGELVGVALRSVDRAPIQIDLVPEVVQAERDEKRRRPFLIGAAAVTLAAFGVMYAGSSSKAGDAERKLASVQKRIKGLEQYSRPIEKQVKREEVIQAFADQFVQAHNGQRYWLELVDDLKQRFGSTHVWVTDMSPLINFKVGSEKPAEEAVRSDFASLAYGAEAAVEPKLDEPATIGKNNRPNPNYVAPMINAVRIKGLWRGAGGASRVNELVKKLTSESPFFTLEITDESGPRPVTRTMTPAEYSEIESMLKEEEYAATFTVTIPLKQPLPLQ
ncbi:Amuc_1101 family PilM-like pilus complex protein [Rubritalea tangerina]|uniref:Amuc_1101 family PilM-like pilus complex protein n=1 Tax=Rubritalea tangerina TaxID=430798 RepID=A0ABW4ZEX1_9BACT